MTAPQPKVNSHILVKEDFISARRYIQDVIHQMNGCYQFEFYDGCAVLSRRLSEILLIEAFEQNGHGAAIKVNNEYAPLADIIAIAQSGRLIKLARGTGKVLQKIKEIGDAAAHSRTYITKKYDIDEVKLELRRVISELYHLAGLDKS